MTSRNRTGLLGAVLLAVGVLLAMWAGALDAQDAAREEAVYCEMVAEGHWPDYRNEYEELCNG